RGIEDAALVVLARPGGGIFRPFVIEVLHAFGVLHEYDVQVRREVLERVPFFKLLEILLPLDAGEVGIDDAHPRFLLLAVTDELAPEHGDGGIDLAARLVLPLSALAMKGVAGAVAADEALAAGDGVEQRLLAGCRHRRRTIQTLLAGQIALRLEEEAIKLGK